MELTRKAINRLKRHSKRFGKSFHQRWTYRRSIETVPIFLCGSQRSGTNMIMRVLDNSPDAWIYNEDDPAAFDKFRLKSFEQRQKLLNKAHCPIVVFKPLADSQNLDRIMAEHPDGKVIWSFRSFYDVANSAVTRWGGGFPGVIKRVAFKKVPYHSQRFACECRFEPTSSITSPTAE